MSCPFARMSRINGHVVAGGLETIINPHGPTTSAARCPISLPGPYPVEDAAAYNVQTHHYLADLHEQHGDRYLLCRDGAPVVFVRDMPAIRKVLTSQDFAKSWVAGDVSTEKVDYVMNLIQPLVTGTVFNHQGEESTEFALDARRKLRPMFIGAKGFAQAFRATLDNDLADATEGSVDSLHLCHNLCRKAILVIIAGDMGADANSMCQDDCNEVMEYFSRRYGMGPGDEPFDQHVSHEDERMMQKMEDGFVRMVDEYKHREALGAFNVSNGASPDHANCLLSIMGKHNATNLELAKLCVNLVIAGGEAMASLLAQTLQELAFNKPVQTKILTEVSALGEAATDSEYIQSCVKEGMRLFAPATLVQRVALRDSELPGGTFIPAGTVVGICVSAVHHNPELFEDSTAFEPNRGGMDLEDINMIDSTLATFSGGSRGCPGRHLAMSWLSLCVHRIVERFELLPAGSRTEWHPDSSNVGVRKFVEWPTNGIPLNLRFRNKHSHPAQPNFEYMSAM